MRNTHPPAMQALAAARSLLFVPGDRPERFEKALRSGADAVVLDLEDAVPVSHKPAARAHIAARWPVLQALGVPLVVRLNAVDSAADRDDIALVQTLPGLAAVMVPKAESAASLATVRAAVPGVALLPLVETAAGLEAVKAVAGAPGVLRLVVGTMDFMADTGIAPDVDEAELAPLRFAVAVAARVAGLAPAIDGVTLETGDERRLEADTRRALRFGFSGKLCIHPRQVAVVHRALQPSSDELEWARRVMAADAAGGGAAVQLDGRMVDVPVVLRAKAILARMRGAGADAPPRDPA